MTLVAKKDENAVETAADARNTATSRSTAVNRSAITGRQKRAASTTAANNAQTPAPMIPVEAKDSSTNNPAMPNGKSHWKTEQAWLFPAGAEEGLNRRPANDCRNQCAIVFPEVWASA